MKKTYHKLVRDKIPEIILEQGNVPRTEVYDDEGYSLALKQKLKEEFDEYNENDDIEELADIVEVVFAIVQHKGVSLSAFEQMRIKKYHERGGFEKRIKLIDVSMGGE